MQILLSSIHFQKISLLKRVYEQFEDVSACIGVPTLLTVDFVVKADIDNSELKNDFSHLACMEAHPHCYILKLYIPRLINEPLPPGQTHKMATMLL